MLRCDGKTQCQDKSDELGCQLVILDETYYKDMLPPGINDDEFALVNVSFSVLSILKISEVDYTFHVKFRLKSEWNDPRLQFKNLKSKSSKNTLSDAQRDEIWTPEMIFTNTNDDFATILDEKVSIKIIRNMEDKFTLSDPDDIENYRIYSGNENLLSLSRVYDVEFICIYNVLWYPFDSQVPVVMDFPGVQELSQYFIKGYNHCTKIIGDKEGVRVEIFLNRRLMGTALTVYLPTIIMNIIGHNTNFFKSYFFEAVISVNLTVMLVLATMFVSVSENLPNTSYIKYIEIWLLFNLLLPFIEVLLHTYMDLQRDEKEDENPEKQSTPQILEKDSKNSWVEKDLVSRRENIQVKALSDHYESGEELMRKKAKRNLARAQMFTNVILPIFAILFVVIYWIIGLLISYYPLTFGVVDHHCDLSK